MSRKDFNWFLELYLRLSGFVSPESCPTATLVPAPRNQGSASWAPLLVKGGLLAGGPCGAISRQLRMHGGLVSPLHHAADEVITIGLWELHGGLQDVLVLRMAE